MPFNPNFPSVPSNPSSWSNAGDGFPDDWIAPAATSIGNPWAAPRPAPLNDGFPDDWITPTTTSAGNRWTAPGQAPLNDGFPDDWIAPAGTSIGNRRAAPGQAPLNYGFPDDWITPTATSIGNPWAGQRQALMDDGFPDDWIAPTTTGNPWGAQSPQSVPLLRVNDEALPRPSWVPGPPLPAFDPWRDQFIKGMQGLINSFNNSRARSGGGGGGDEDCHSRWEAEDARCEQWAPYSRPPGRWAQACRQRAADRRSSCISNGGRPRPDEPPEYGFSDIPMDPIDW